MKMTSGFSSDSFMVGGEKKLNRIFEECIQRTFATNTREFSYLIENNAGEKPEKCWLHRKKFFFYFYLPRDKERKSWECGKRGREKRKNLIIVVHFSWLRTGFHPGKNFLLHFLANHIHHGQMNFLIQSFGCREIFQVEAWYCLFKFHNPCTAPPLTGVGKIQFRVGIFSRDVEKKS